MPPTLTMKRENSVISAAIEPMVRVTRSRAAVSEKSMVASTGELPKQRGQKRALQISSDPAILRVRNKNVPLTSCVEQKCRPVLKDVTNLCCNTSNGDAVKVPVSSSSCFTCIIYIVIDTMRNKFHKLTVVEFFKYQ